jgi:hypothetical protein
VDVDWDLIRILVRQRCRRSTLFEGEMSGHAVFDRGAAPGYQEQREVVKAHNQLLLDRGIAEVGRIESRNHPDFAVLEPTESGMHWCRCAHDDDLWEQHVDDLRQLLTADR